MKKTLLLLLTLGLVAPSLKAQDVTPLTYSEVIQVDGVSKDELFSRAKLFFVNTYNNATKVIQNEDKDAGIIAGKAITSDNIIIGKFSGSGATDAPATYTITLAVKDGRYKYTITDIVQEKLGLLTTSPDNPDIPVMAGKKWKEEARAGIKKSADFTFGKLIDALKTEMNKTAPTEEDW